MYAENIVFDEENQEYLLIKIFVLYMMINIFVILTVNVLSV